MILDINKYKKEILIINSEEEFNSLAINAFLYQYDNNSVYQDYCKHLNIIPHQINKLEQIPFIPIEFFKSHKLISNTDKIETTFESSGTTGMQRSHHHINDLKHYENCFVDTFSKFYGSPDNYVILGLLPSYLERSGSSLVYMVNKLIKLSSNKRSGFYLDEFDSLHETILKLETEKQKYILIGVSFALIDFANTHPINIQSGIVMETGGMKGRRKELTKTELHKFLSKHFKTKNIHSEYGMTELLSQAYSKENGIFRTPTQMKIMIRDTYDPLSVSKSGTGAINVIDLANIDSCCFIATSDLGKVQKDGTFSIKGRFDHAEIRGCNLLVY